MRSASSWAYTSSVGARCPSPLLMASLSGGTYSVSTMEAMSEGVRSVSTSLFLISTSISPW